MTHENMTKLLPGELRIRGVVHKDGSPGIRCAFGEGITEQQSQAVAEYFNQPRYAVLHEGELKSPWEPFIGELHKRHYDIASLRFSIFLRSAGRKVAKRPGLIAQRFGMIHSRWARVEHSDPDVCSAWGRPCQRADSNLWLSLLSNAQTERDLRSNQKTWPATFEWGGLLSALKREGFDERTLRFCVKSKLPLHPDDLPSSPELEALVTLGPYDCPAFKKRCPVCGAEEGQSCSRSDPDDDRLAIELGDKVHARRLAS